MLTTKTLEQVLRETKELLSDQSRWTQFANARAIGRTEGNPPCESWDPNAVCWCLNGALDKVTECKQDSDRWYGVSEKARRVLSSAGDKLGYTQGGGVIFINDTLGYEVVMKVLEYALVHCEELARLVSR